MKKILIAISIVIISLGLSLGINFLVEKNNSNDGITYNLVGDSITKQYSSQIENYTNRKYQFNYIGQPGKTTKEVYDMLDQFEYDSNDKYVIMLGSNDLEEYSNYESQLTDLVNEFISIGTPVENIYIMSIPPLGTSDFDNGVDENRDNSDVDAINELNKQVSVDTGVNYLYNIDYLRNDDGYYKDYLTLDGLHFSAYGIKRFDKMISHKLGIERIINVTSIYFIMLTVILVLIFIFSKNKRNVINIMIISFSISIICYIVYNVLLMILIGH